MKDLIEFTPAKLAQEQQYWFRMGREAFAREVVEALGKEIGERMGMAGFMDFCAGLRKAKDVVTSLANPQEGETK